MRETLPPDIKLESTSAQDSLAEQRPALIRKMLFSATGLAATLAGNAVIFLIIAKSVDVPSFGVFAKSYVVASLLTLLVDFGYPQRILRDLPHYRQRFNGLPTRIFHLKAMLTIVASIVAVPLAIILHLNLLHFCLIWAGLLMLSFGNVGGVALRAFERHGVDGRNLLIANGAAAACALALALSGTRNITPFTCVFLISGGIYLVLSAISARQHIEIVRERFARSSIYDEFRRGLSYASDVFVVRSYGFADVLILTFFSGPVGIGIYQLGQKLMQLMLPTAQVITNVLLPRLSRKAIARGSSLRDLLLLTVTIGGFGVAAAIAFYLFAGIGVDWFLEPDYAPVKALIPIFALTIGARTASVAPSIWLVAAGRQRERLVMNMLNLVVFVVLCVVLSAQAGAKGTAIATGISAFILMALYYSVAIIGHKPGGQVA